MLRKTHLAAGVAATLIATQPNTLSELLLAVGGGSIGALISDIDSGTSASHKDADRITLATIGILAGTAALDYFFHTNIISRIIASSGYARLTGGILLFLAICAFGKEQPHRSFMHSFLALFLLDLAAGIVWKNIIPYFTVGFLSHLALDLFNKKRVKLLYPFKRGIAFDLCRSDGIVNKSAFLVGSFLIAIELWSFVLRLLR